MNNRLVSTLGYIGYSILYTFPLIGLIFVLIHSFAGDYQCRKNYARAFLLIRIVTVVSLVVLFYSNMDAAKDIYNYIREVRS